MASITASMQGTFDDDDYYDDDRHNKEPNEENKENPPSAPEFSLIPSKTPSSTPTSIPSLIPTSLPTLVPTSMPSAQPTIQPSMSPTCKDIDNGNTFGTTSTTEPQVLTYIYEMETDPNSDASVADDILPSVEREITGMIAANFAEFTCVENEVVRRHRKLARRYNDGHHDFIKQAQHSNNRMLLQGLSSAPADVVLQDSCKCNVFL